MSKYFCVGTQLKFFVLYLVRVNTYQKWDSWDSGFLTNYVYLCGSFIHDCYLLCVENYIETFDDKCDEIMG